MSGWRFWNRSDKSRPNGHSGRYSRSGNRKKTKQRMPGSGGELLAGDRTFRELGFEPLECRELMTVFVVNSTADDENFVDYSIENYDGGATITFRDAMNFANAAAGEDTIEFNIGTGTQTIVLGSTVVATDSVIIDGYSQPGSAANTQAVGTDATLNIIISANFTSGSSLQFDADASGSQVRGLVFQNTTTTGSTDASITVNNASGLTIAGNYFGTDATGTVEVEASSHAIYLNGGSDNVIGGSDPADRNVFGGDYTATGKGMVYASSANGTGNRVEGNYFGIGSDGTTLIVSSSDPDTRAPIGIDMGSLSDGVIADNVIGGTSIGIRLHSSGNSVVGNYIGLDATGTAAIAAQGDTANGGIYLIDNAWSNTIGGTTADERNVIASYRYGVQVRDSSKVSANLVTGNYIGFDKDGTGNFGGSAIGVVVGGAGSLNSVTANVIGNWSDAGIASNNSNTWLAQNTIGVNALGNAATAVTGIRLSGNNNITVTGNVIQNASSYGILVNNSNSNHLIDANTLTGNNQGIRLTGSSGAKLMGIRVSNNVVYNNSGYGIYVYNSSNGTINGTVIENNSATGNNYGIRQEATTGNTISGSQILGNTLSGNTNGNILEYANGAGEVMGSTIQGNVLTGATHGIRLLSVNNGTVSGQQISNNTVTGAGTYGVYLVSTLGMVRGVVVNGNVITGNGRAGVGIEANTVSAYVQDNLIGGTTVADRNILSGNTSYGSVILGSGATGNSISGNYIGILADGSVSANAYGVSLAASSNVVGGTLAGAGNIISGNSSYALWLKAADSNLIAGNRFALNVAGNNTIAGGSGSLIVIEGSKDNTFGGTTLAARNYIAGGSNGLNFSGNTTTGNWIVGNYIGTDINGTIDLGASGDGIVFNSGASRNTVGGETVGAGNLIAGHNGNAVHVSLGTANRIAGNSIGLNSTGVAAISSGRGILIEGASRDNTIGGDTSLSGNYIAGFTTRQGVWVSGSSATGTVIQGNYIGLGTDGDTSVANSVGIQLTGVSGTRIIDNVISGNSSLGVHLTGGTSGTLIVGNFVGLNAAGDTGRGNSIGIYVDGNATDNTIGGLAAGDRNVISGNTSQGVFLTSTSSGNTVQGNYIGTDATGNSGLSNGTGVYVSAKSSLIDQNVLSGNASQGLYFSSAASANIASGNFIGTNAAGTASVANARGVYLSGASGNLIDGNLIAGNSGNAMWLKTAVENLFTSNTVGLNIDGDAIGNGSGSQIILEGATDNTFGGTTALDRNIFSGGNGNAFNASGTTTTGNHFVGNYIGTDATGTLDRGNGNNGILFSYGANGNVVGGTLAGAGNLIAGNNNAGVSFEINGGAYSTGNLVVGNTFGLGSDGSTIISGSYGVLDASGSNTIGGTSQEYANFFTGTTVAAVSTSGSQTQVIGNRFDNNPIAVRVTGSANDVSILSNEYFTNETEIALNSGTNHDQAAPVLTSAEWTGSQLNVTLTAASDSYPVLVQFYRYVEGLTELVGEISINSAGSQNISFSPNPGVYGNDLLFATTTRNETGSTSAFSTGVSVVDSSGNTAPDVASSFKVLSGTNVLTFAASDFNNASVYVDGDPLVGIRIAGLPTHGTLYLETGSDPILVEQGQTLTLAQLDQLRYQPEAGIDEIQTIAYQAFDGNAYSEVVGVALLPHDLGLTNVYYVTNTLDDISAMGSLRWAVDQANSSVNTFDAVLFAIADYGPRTISMASTLTITDRIYLDGFSQYDAAPNSLTAGTDAMMQIVVTRSSGFGSTLALTSGASDSTLRGLVLQTYTDTTGVTGADVSANDAALELINSSGNTIVGNYFNVGPNGSSALAAKVHGLSLSGSSDNTIGGTSVIDRNIFGGNYDGADVTKDLSGLGYGWAMTLLNNNSEDNYLLGNYYGIGGATGTTRVTTGNSSDEDGRAYGIHFINGSDNNVIGGADPAATNYIVAYKNRGLRIDTSGNLVQGNIIGLDATGTVGFGSSGNAYGIILSSSANYTTVTGNVISGTRGGANLGLYIYSADYNLVQSNIIGLGIDGLNGVNTGNASDGIRIYSNSKNNTIGGLTESERNLLGGNNTGLRIGDTAVGNEVYGNYIGVSFDGVTDVGNSYGVLLETSATRNTIGGTVDGARNIISGNDSVGVYLRHGISENVIVGNYIGLANDGVTAVGNGTGIRISSASGLAPIGNFIRSNVISGNSGDGILVDIATDTVSPSANVFTSNLIGLSADGSSIVGNGTYGINVLAGDNNTFGGLTGAEGNTLAGGSSGVDGIVINGSGNVIYSNAIGMDGSGGSAPFAGSGVRIASGSGNIVLANDFGNNATSSIQLDPGANNDTSLASFPVSIKEAYIAANGQVYVIYTVSEASTVNFYLPGTGTDATSILVNTVTVAGTYAVTLGLATDLGLGDGSDVAISYTNDDGTTEIENYFTVTVSDTPGYDGIQNIYVVTNTSDDVNTVGSLRYAINQANTHIGYDAIIFYIQGFGIQVITAASSLTVTDQVYIDGYSQPVTARATNQTLADATLFIEVAGNFSSGSTLQLDAGASGSIVSGLILSGVGTGGNDAALLLNNVTGAQVVGNYVGYDGTGALAMQSHGIVVLGGTDNTIGGTTYADRNVLGGDFTGTSASERSLIQLTNATATLIAGNFIGLDGNERIHGAVDNYQYHGVHLTGSTVNTTVGGATAEYRNVIVARGRAIRVVSSGDGQYFVNNYIGTDANGNSTAAVKGMLRGFAVGAGSDQLYIINNVISGAAEYGIALASAFNVVQGNLIGTDASGTVDYGNANSGILLDGGSTLDNTIGGLGVGEGNLIAGNNSDGIRIQNNTRRSVILGNTIGLGATGSALNNSRYGILVTGVGTNNQTIGSNVISGNSSVGIQIEAGATGALIQQNTIGLGASGTVVANGSYGIRITGTGTNDHTIGGTSAGEGNVLSGNTGSQVYLSNTTGNLVAGNIIGLDASGNAVTGGPVANGITLDEGASQNTIGGSVTGARNVISGNNGDGIRLNSTGSLIVSANLIAGNYIGTNLAGSAAIANSGSGIAIDRAAGNTIGGTDVAYRNLISGNSSAGVSLSNGASANVIAGNYIGTSETGLTAIGNSGTGGVVLDNAKDNTIGGSSAGAGNLISGNTGRGIYASGSQTTGNVIAANWIGVDSTGDAALRNTAHGIYFLGVYDNTIGGTTAGARNIVSGNNNENIYLANGTTGTLIAGNYVGLNAAGTASVAGATGSDGIYLLASETTANTIGGYSAAYRNVISGNKRNGVTLNGSDGNLFAGNYVGLNANGDAAVKNGTEGFLVAVTAVNNTFGGTVAGAGNVISGNGANGIYLRNDGGLGSSGNLIAGNIIGLSADGLSRVGNSGSGVYSSSSYNTIGGSVAGAQNVIAGNSGSNIYFSGAHYSYIAGNILGLNVNADAAFAAGTNNHNVFLFNSANNTVGGTTALERNIISGVDGNGVVLYQTGATGNRIVGNYIGTGPNGDETSLGNKQVGILFAYGASDNTVGGLLAAERNIISANVGIGIQIRYDSATDTATSISTQYFATGNEILGNYIGVAVDGTTGLGNSSSGIQIETGNNTVGGSTAAARNVIANNNGSGVIVNGTYATANVIAGNYVGFGADGTTPLGNRSYNNITISGNDNTVGGPTAAWGNLIGNATYTSSDAAGIATNTSRNLFSYNTIGINADGDPAGNNFGIRLSGGSQNSFLYNSIAYNIAGKGIDIKTHNNEQPAPVITSLELAGDQLTITFSAEASGNNYPVRVQFFRAQGDQGIQYLDETYVNDGNPVTITITVPVGFSTSDSVVATATRANGSTSNFSANGDVPDSPPTATGFTATGNEDTTLLLSAADFATGYADANLEAFAGAQIDSLPSNGTLEYFTGVSWVAVTTGFYAPAELDQFRFVPDTNWSGTTSFTFRVSDGHDLSTPVTATLQIDAVPDSPDLSVDPQFWINAGTTKALSVVHAQLVDDDGSETLSVTIQNVPSSLSFSTGTNNNDGTWTFTQAELNAAQVVATAITSPAYYTLSVVATASEDGNSASSATESFRLFVVPQAVADVFYVTNTEDNVGSAGSLAWAIDQANADPNYSAILFDMQVPANTGSVWTITSTQDLTLTESVYVDAYSQAGASANTLATGSDATLKIVVARDTSSGSVLELDGASGSELRGLVLQGLQSSSPTDEAALRIAHSTGVVIAGNYINTAANGVGLIDVQSHGILIDSSSADVTIGGAGAEDRNVLGGNVTSGDRSLIVVDGNAGGVTGVVIENNYLGVGADGTSAVVGSSGGGNTTPAGVSLLSNSIGTAIRGNVFAGVAIGINIAGSDGNLIEDNLIGFAANGVTAIPGMTNVGLDTAAISIVGGSNNTIGGLAHGNVLGNYDYGIQLDSGANANLIASNLIGFDVTGENAAPISQSAISITNSQSNTLGGPTADWGNTLGNAADAGIHIEGDDTLIKFNTIGASTLGLDAANDVGIRIASGSGNAIVNNSIRYNTSTGIERQSGANEDQSAPVFTSAEVTSGQLALVFNVPNGTNPIVVQIFRADNGQGYELVATWQSDGSYVFGDDITVEIPPGTLVDGDSLVAIATRDDGGGSSSAFSAPITVEFAPSLSGITGGTETLYDNQTIAPFATATVTNDAGTSVTVTVQLSSAANGTLSGGGFVSAGSGAYTFTGVAAAATSALQALVFTPTNHQVAAGTAVETTFEVTVVATNGLSASNDTTTLRVTAYNTAPVISGMASSQIAYNVGSGWTQLTQGKSIQVTDPDYTPFVDARLEIRHVEEGTFTESLVIATTDTIARGGNTVFFQGAAIGTVISGGQYGSDLVIELNAAATPLAVSNLIKAIGYVNSATQFPQTVTRNLMIRLVENDPSTVTSLATQTSQLVSIQLVAFVPPGDGFIVPTYSGPLPEIDRNIGANNGLRIGAGAGFGGAGGVNNITSTSIDSTISASRSELFARRGTSPSTGFDDRNRYFTGDSVMYNQAMRSAEKVLPAQEGFFGGGGNSNGRTLGQSQDQQEMIRNRITRIVGDGLLAGQSDDEIANSVRTEFTRLKSSMNLELDLENDALLDYIGRARRSAATEGIIDPEADNNNPQESAPESPSTQETQEDSPQASSNGQQVPATASAASSVSYWSNYDQPRSDEIALDAVFTRSGSDEDLLAACLPDLQEVVHDGIASDSRDGHAAEASVAISAPVVAPAALLAAASLQSTVKQHPEEPKSTRKPRMLQSLRRLLGL